MVMKGLCTGLGDEKGLGLGDFGEGTTRGGGIANVLPFIAAKLLFLLVLLLLLDGAVGAA